MDFEKIKAIAHCCVSRKPLADSKYLNGIVTNYKATWQFPVGGNVITKEYGRAMAFVHDDHVGCKQEEIIEVVEFKEDTIIYHPVAELEEFPKPINPLMN
ncbi:MAG: hypothetical protein EKK37_17430 [Sphingobacteriales bacterium]|nr:MAG: hypothetical protein EKK37_17430 [Sphingobacteriales bacterium]